MVIELETVAKHIVSPYFIWIWSVMMASYALFWVSSLVIKARKITSQVSLSNRSLRKNKNNIQKSLMEISNLSIIKPIFESFSLEPQIENSSASKEPLKFTLPANASEIINEDSIITPNIDQKTYESVGSQLSAIGILGTFIGLSASIYLARGALASSNMTEMRSALDQLLGGAALAFWTSVIGIASSLVYSRFESNIISNTKQRIQELADSLHLVSTTKSLEQISIEQLCELREQNKSLQELATSITKSLSSQSKIQEAALKNIVYEFRTELTNAAPKEMKAIASNCQEILASVKQEMFGLKDSNSSLLAASQKIGQSMEVSLTKAAENFSSKLIQTTDIIEASAKTASAEMGIGILEAGIFAAEQIKKPAEDISFAISDLSEKTRRATNDWTDAMISMEKFSSIFNAPHLSNASEPKRKLTPNNSSLTLNCRKNKYKPKLNQTNINSLQGETQVSKIGSNKAPDSTQDR